MVFEGEDGREGIGESGGIGVGRSVDESASGEGEGWGEGVDGEFGEEDVITSRAGAVVHA